MSLNSRLLELAKVADAVLGRPLARAAHGGRRQLPEDPGDVLLIRLWGLGNLALMAPQFVANRRRRLRLLTLERNLPFMSRQFPHVQVLPLPDPSSPRFPGAVIGLGRRLARDPPEVIVDCEQFLRLPLALARCSCPAPCVGLDTPSQGRGRLLDRSLAYDPQRHVARTFAALWALAGLDTDGSPGGLSSAPERQATLRQHHGLDERPLVILHPGSGDHFPGRRWSPERFAALLSTLEAAGGRGTYQFALTGDASERKLTRRIVATAGLSAAASVHDLAGRLDVESLLDLLASATLLITNDTGPLHLADALGTITLGLFGPNTPQRYGPRRKLSLALHAGLPCSPCLDDRNMKRSACRHFSCMTSLTVEDVAAAAFVALSGQDLASPPTVHGVHAHAS